MVRDPVIVTGIGVGLVGIQPLEHRHKPPSLVRWLPRLAVYQTPAPSPEFREFGCSVLCASGITMLVLLLVISCCVLCGSGITMLVLLLVISCCVLCGSGITMLVLLLVISCCVLCGSGITMLVLLLVISCCVLCETGLIVFAEVGFVVV